MKVDAVVLSVKGLRFDSHSHAIRCRTCGTLLSAFICATMRSNGAGRVVQFMRDERALSLHDGGHASKSSTFDQSWRGGCAPSAAPPSARRYSDTISSEFHFPTAAARAHTHNMRMFGVHFEASTVVLIENKTRMGPLTVVLRGKKVKTGRSLPDCCPESSLQQQVKLLRSCVLTRPETCLGNLNGHAHVFLCRCIATT